jgi:hypothetical protein
MGYAAAGASDETGTQMTDTLAAILWLGLAAYLGFGFLVGLGVIGFGLARLTPAPIPMRVRFLILPGLAALWPVILLRLSGIRPPEDRAPETPA